MSKKDNLLLNKAINFVNKAHENQTYGDQPFVYHPLQVYEVITLLKPADVNLRVAALLHDTIEDTETTKEQIEKEFNSDVAELVSEVSKTSYNTFPNLKSTRGIVLKFADRLCNLSSMMAWSEEKQERYRNKSKFWKS